MYAYKLCMYAHKLCMYNYKLRMNAHKLFLYDYNLCMNICIIKILCTYASMHISVCMYIRVIISIELCYDYKYFRLGYI